MESSYLIWTLRALCKAVCVPHVYYWVVATMDLGHCWVPEAHTGCDHVFLPLFLKNFACLWVSVRRPRKGACQECWLEQHLPLDMHLSHLLNLLCHFSPLSSPALYTSLYDFLKYWHQHGSFALLRVLACCPGCLVNHGEYKSAISPFQDWDFSHPSFCHQA